MTIKKALYISLLFIVIALISQISILPYHNIPPLAACKVQDICYHMTNIIKAEEAILEGEYWLQTAPGIVQQWAYPLFQFYTPFFYMVMGYVALLFQDPFNAVRTVLTLSALVGGWYSYKLYYFLFRNEVAAILGAVLYLFSPYLLQNIGARNDFAEAFTQCIFPATLYYWFRLYTEEKWNQKKGYFLAVGILSNYCLMTAHLITFITTTGFMLLLFGFLAWQSRSFRLLNGVFCCLVITAALAAWYLVPILLDHHFLAIDYFNIKNPWNMHAFTLFHKLISPLSFHPPASADVQSMVFSFSLGLPLTCSALYWLYQICIKRTKNTAQIPLIKITLALFLFCVFLTWSPFDFWQFLPHITYVIQFTYRLLSDCMWLGGILFVAMLAQFCKSSLNPRQLILGLIIIAILNLQWLPQVPAADRNISTNKGLLDSAYPVDYLIVTDLIDFPTLSGPFLNVLETEKSCSFQPKQSSCQITVSQPQENIQLPILYYPHLLKIKANGQNLPYFPSEFKSTATPYVLATVTLPRGTYTITNRFTGVSSANIFSLIAWILYGIGILLLIGYKIKRRR